MIRSPILGVMFTVVYFLINTTFLENAVFKEKEIFMRFGLGGLLLIALLGLVGWVTLITYNLDIIRSTIVFLVVGALSSIANRMGRYTFSIEFVRDISKT